MENKSKKRLEYYLTFLILIIDRDRVRVSSRKVETGSRGQKQNYRKVQVSDI